MDEKAIDAAAAVREALMDATASLAAAISLLERSPKRAAPSNKMFDAMLNDYRASLKRARAALSSTVTDPVAAAYDDAAQVARSHMPMFQDMEYAPVVEKCENIARAIEARRDAVGANEWQPISTAPKDIPIWLSDGFAMRVGCWHKERWADFYKLPYATGRTDILFVPTLWLPLPKSPRSKENSK